MEKLFHEDFLLLAFFEILIVKNFLFSEIFFLWDCSIMKICFNCSSLRLKNCFSLLVLRLKIFVLVIWFTVIGLGSDFKMDANLGLEFGILIDSGSDLKFEMIFLTLVIYLGWLFAQLSWFCCFLMCLWNFEFGYCFVIMGMIGFHWLKWIWPNWIGFAEILQLLRPLILFFFFLKNFILLIFLSLVD